MDRCRFERSSSTQGEKRESKEEGSGLKKRCVEMAKEQRSRFYIFRRCITMLLCWHKYENH
ncbi:DEVIL-like protein [Trema orientale]|uniref:DEVIL-like protein n=2 Tax=Cannabaceae TaxID=3481 RepID=A0A2P5B554_PARAD|nr:DEVIL-like protein [Parasponia andersonii]PON82582.1 DEVIL-like protein [Trema orientale]